MAFAVWFTGLPGSGKSVISRKAAEILRREGYMIRILQLDRIRRTITPEPSYSDEERSIVYASLAYMAYLLVDCGINVFIDATANKQEYRDTARSLIPNFAEAYVDCPLEVCIRRERDREETYDAPRGVYVGSKRSGATVPGVNVAYEPPRNPEIHVESSKETIEECARRVAEKVEELFG
ncbi:MAG: adenylyl-sulfate kinase [Methanosarcinales archaeon]